MNNFRPCPDCKSNFEGIYCFGWREGPLEKLVEEYKYQSIRAMKPTLVDFYDTIVPDNLGDDVIVVPLPTIGKHIRKRGFDHTLTLAKALAHRRGWECQSLLVRTVDTVQVGSKISQRQSQASKSYALKTKIDPARTYLLLDDVWTTGATMNTAAQLFRDADATHLHAAILAVSRPPAKS